MHRYLYKSRCTYYYVHLYVQMYIYDQLRLTVV